MRGVHVRVRANGVGRMPARDERLNELLTQSFLALPKEEAVSELALAERLQV